MHHIFFKLFLYFYKTMLTLELPTVETISPIYTFCLLLLYYAYLQQSMVEDAGYRLHILYFLNKDSTL